MLPVLDEKDPLYLKTKIYFFGTADNIEIYISKKNNVEDVIKHIITLYMKNPSLSKKAPLKYPKSPGQYELRLIDDEDDENSFQPYYDIGALETQDEIGEFESLAFIEVK